MNYLKDQEKRSPLYLRRITDRKPELFDDLDENETEGSRIWTILIIFSLSAIVGTGFLAALIWALFKLGGGS